MTRRLKVAIVDDDKYLLQMLSHVLEAGGFTVLPYHSGNTALLDIPEEKPDCVLSDINMSGINGLDLVRELREMEECAKIRFFIMSAEDGDTWKQQARKAGAHGYLAKPLDANKLSDHLRQMLQA